MSSESDESLFPGIPLLLEGQGVGGNLGSRLFIHEDK